MSEESRKRDAAHQHGDRDEARKSEIEDRRPEHDDAT